ncbi:alpha/beta hydrolase [Acinetobacter sp. ANC 7454]|uniref:alpha/beta hydrolase n=1 Tax=Acinetobacter thermotolerans TaxID=3151487 RepID=UPI00325B2782
MPNKVYSLKAKLSSHLNVARQVYRDFRLYDLGSYALNRLTPKAGYNVEKHLAYGLKARQRFDLYRTAQPLTHRPLIVFVHGGAWMHGDKKDYQFIGEAFAREGYDVVIPNYHLAPEYIFPHYVDDLHLLLDYLQASSHRLQISVENIVLMGHSAGAFNVMSAVYYPKQHKSERLANIRAIIGLAGPYHFDYKDDPLCADAFDQSVPYQQVMPLYFVQPQPVKHYLFIAEKDTIVGHFNSHDLDRVLKQHGNHSHVISISKLGHITIVGSLSSLFSRFFPTKSKVLWALEDAFK